MSCKKVIRKARFLHVGCIAKSVEYNFCRPSLPPLLKSDKSLAHTAAEKANLFAENLRLDDGSVAPPSISHCGSSSSWGRSRYRGRLLMCSQYLPKKGSRADPSNYRPIAITSILCKVMERVLNAKFLVVTANTGSTEIGPLGTFWYMLLTFGVNLLRSMVKLLLCLYSKAFDRVWHRGLFSRIPPVLCSWISDFLRNRSKRVVIDECSSDLMAINAGVPQGLVLSATLLLLHINDLLIPDVFGEVMVQRTNSTSEAMSDWGSANLVQFSAAKTQAYLFTAKRRPFTFAPTVQRRVSLPPKVHLEDLLELKVSSPPSGSLKAQITPPQSSMKAKGLGNYGYLRAEPVKAHLPTVAAWLQEANILRLDLTLIIRRFEASDIKRSEFGVHMLTPSNELGPGEIGGNPDFGNYRKCRWASYVDDIIVETQD
ncbi:hypothetical protein MSG28_009816 [Choristoneura fumiferana]|uniref:Uncharacterized protein n=1 Tax=Choristoneura fumiferana TaxID=7141 RepID=A0ACC0JCR6_CHOFU|nr:hypothetical protein MSG28_009816 [Choristoneura fumiferana]